MSESGEAAGPGAGGHPLKAQAIVVGSGAGGALTAAHLAERGYDVLLLEEGPRVDATSIRSNSTEAISRLYRNGGMTPILGNLNMAYVEGRCVGGSTEVNSGFWHRLPADSYYRWKADYLLDEFEPDAMDGYFDGIEAELSVSRSGTDKEGRGSAVFRRGIEKLAWKYEEVPRCMKDPSASAFSPGQKQSMAQTYIPRAIRAGARLISGCKVRRLVVEGGRVVGVDALLTDGAETAEWRIRAELVFLCCGAVQTPALLRRSGIKKNVGDNLRIHPMIKAGALFEDEMETRDAAIPIYQVKEFWPTITIGGSVFSPGFLAMLLSDNWTAHAGAMDSWHHMGLFHAATRGLNRGSIRVLPGVQDGVVVRYRLNRADQRNLSIGFARLGEILFAAGAKAVYGSLRSFPAFTSADQCRSFLKADIPLSSMSLSTVHVFSSCPMGENPDLCATDSFGRVIGFDNLYVNDASLLPDSPGVNPQGTTMAIARRNLDYFFEDSDRRRRSPQRSPRSEGRPSILVTGATGWLGTRLVERFYDEEPKGGSGRIGGGVRCLVPHGMDPSKLTAVDEGVSLTPGDLRDLDSLRAFCKGAEDSTLVHLAGVIHPGRVAEFEEVNVEGTRNLLLAARDAGVRRVVVMSSNSPIGCNPHRDHLFDEDSPYQPYMGYGRSKVAMEKLVIECQAVDGLETVIIRAPWFYGPHQPARQTQFFQMIRAGRFPILGDGRQRRSMAYVDNLCDGLLLAMTRAEAVGRTYWIADERPYSMNEIVDTVEDVLESEFGIACSHGRMRLPSAVGDLAQAVDWSLQKVGLYEQRIHVLGEMNKTIACSVERAKAELGYAPRFELRGGMIESIRWCLENGQHI